jgi:hypothetical protein
MSRFGSPLKRERMVGANPALSSPSSGYTAAGLLVVYFTSATPPYAIHARRWPLKFDAEATMDGDLEDLSREQLIAEVRRLRHGIREHRDSTGHELCWHRPALWSLLPETSDPLPVVPDWPQFLRGCIRYRQSLDEQAPHAPRSDEPYDK